MVVARLGRDAQIAGKERGADFGHQFLAGITFIAESLTPEIAV